MFSLHSSFVELLEFVSAIKPRRIIPTVRYNDNMKPFDDFINKTPSDLVIIPESIAKSLHSIASQRKRRLPLLLNDKLKIQSYV